MAIFIHELCDRRDSLSSTRDKIDLSLLMSKEVRASKIAFFLLLSVYFAENIRGDSFPPCLSKPLEFLLACRSSLIENGPLLLPSELIPKTDCPVAVDLAPCKFYIFSNC